jgi:hypothetical protein
MLLDNMAVLRSNMAMLRYNMTIFLSNTVMLRSNMVMLRSCVEMFLYSGAVLCLALGCVNHPSNLPLASLRVRCPLKGRLFTPRIAYFTIQKISKCKSPPFSRGRCPKDRGGEVGGLYLYFLSGLTPCDWQPQDPTGLQIIWLPVFQ